ncbi:sulfatase [Candidatus Daviesbacteria bacterium]|nr:sulfatase [Candidatus Daviesbacteria bacterium]
MKFPLFLLTGSIAVLFLLSPILQTKNFKTQAATTSSKPNIIVIMTDDQTMDSMSKMPLTNKLIGGAGATFANSFVANSLCCPSRATFLTGQYSHNNHVFSNKGTDGGYSALTDNSNVLPIWLQVAGYTTFHVGKYLNGYGKVTGPAPADPASVPSGWTEEAVGWQDSIYSYYNYTLNEYSPGVAPHLVTYGSDNNEYQINVETTKSLDFINRHANDSNPYFMWICYFAPHGDSNAGKVVAANQDLHTFDNEPLPTPPSFNEADVSDKPAYIQNLNNGQRFSQSDINDITTNYRNRLDALQSVDRGVQAIVTTLQLNHQMDNTVVIFTSDNGFFHGEHRKSEGKVLAYEPSIRVPLLIRGPGYPVQTISRPAVNIDLAATIVDIAGAKAGRTFDGLSLVPLLKNQPVSSWRSDFLIESDDSDPGHIFTGVRSEDHKYVEWVDTVGKITDTEYYNLNTDPDELCNMTYSGKKECRNVDIVNLYPARTRLHQLQTCKGESCH